MTHNKARKIIALVLVALSVLLIAAGITFLIMRNGRQGQDVIQSMRINAVIKASGDVNTFVDIAKKEAKTRAQQELNADKAWTPNGENQADAPVLSDEYKAAILEATGLEYDEYKEQVKNKKIKTVSLTKIVSYYQANAEAEVLASFSSDSEIEIAAENETELKTALLTYADALKKYYTKEKVEKDAYEKEQYEINRQIAEKNREAKLAAGEEVSEELIVPLVDMSKFVPSADAVALSTEADKAYLLVGEELKKNIPQLNDEALSSLKPTLSNAIFQSGDDFALLYDRYIASDNKEALESPFFATLIRHSDDLIYAGLALLVVTALLLYYETLNKKLGLPRIVLGTFFILLCFLCLWYDLSLPALLSNTLVRLGMNAIMVLAMVPGIQCGISLNLGLPIGLVAGLVGGLCTIEWGIPGAPGFLVAICIGVVIAVGAGWLYALMLNRLKGEEMSVTTYVGFSIVSLMCIAWLVLPFKSLKLRWPMGTGLRNTIGLDSTNFKHVLDDFLSFSIGDMTIPTGSLLFMALMCLLVWLFTRSKTGVAMAAVGNNPRFAEATGINVNKMRIIGTVLSTVLGAIGILVYSQSYGFMQLYTAPRQMGFVAASAILIGGATTSRCKISHVIIGTFLFQGVLTLGMPVANVLVPGSTFSETLRILISNGIILYALTKSGGGSRG